MSDLTEKELLEGLEYQEKEIMRPLKLSGRPIDEYHLKQQEIIAQFRKIVEGHFSKPSGMAPTVFSEKMVEDYWKEQDAKHKADQEQGVDEELIERTLEKLSECCDVGYSYTQDREWGELDKEKAGAIIKQLLTRQPMVVDEGLIEAIVDMVDFSILPRRWSKKDIELVVRYTAKELLTRQPVESGWVWCPVCEKRIEVIDKRLQPVQVEEAIQDIAKFYLPGKTVEELLILELEQIGKRLYKNGDTVGARTIRKAIELLTQKRTVTREWVKSWVGYASPKGLELEKVIVMLKELDIGVVTKK